MNIFLAMGLLAFVPPSADVEALVFQLRSVDQQDRDRAAAALREVYVPTVRGRWEPLVDSIEPGTPKVVLLELFAPARPQGGPGTGQRHMEIYALDDCWVVYCWFNNANNSLHSIELKEYMRSVWVEPAEHFSGVWTTYFVNGEKSHEVEYKNGKRHGTFTAYHSDGSKSYVQHVIDNVADGSDIGYFPSGKVSYRGNYRKGKQVGTWTWYEEDGSVRSEQKFGDDPAKASVIP